MYYAMVKEYRKHTHRTDIGFTLAYNDFEKMPAHDSWDFMIDFIYHSNGIENIWEKKGSPGVSQEVRGHKKALDYVVNNFERLPTADDIKRIHFDLMDGLLSEDKVGSYRDCNVYIVGDGCMISTNPFPKHVPELITNLEDKINNCSFSWKQVWEVHHEFESIHPFVDGNGRTGRLLLNWMGLNLMGKFGVVKEGLKIKYYERIQDYRSKFVSRVGKEKFPPIDKVNKQLEENRMKKIIGTMILGDREHGID